MIRSDYEFSFMTFTYLLVTGQDMRTYLRRMANCAVKHFGAGRADELPEDQREAAGYVPDVIDVSIKESALPSRIIERLLF